MPTPKAYLATSSDTTQKVVDSVVTSSDLLAQIGAATVVVFLTIGMFYFGLSKTFRLYFDSKANNYSASAIDVSNLFKVSAYPMALFLLGVGILTLIQIIGYTSFGYDFLSLAGDFWATSAEQIRTVLVNSKIDKQYIDSLILVVTVCSAFLFHFVGFWNIILVAIILFISAKIGFGIYKSQNENTNLTFQAGFMIFTTVGIMTLELGFLNLVASRYLFPKSVSTADYGTVNNLNNLTGGIIKYYFRRGLSGNPSSTSFNGGKYEH